MNLTEAQRQRVTAWIAEGAKLGEIQNRLAVEFGLRLTYMDTRFLVDDLKLVPKDPERPKVPDLPAPAKPSPPAAKPAPPGAEAVADELLPPPAGGGKISVTVDQITRPGSLVSGKVTFSDGQLADWYLDQMGRLGVAPRQQGYKPSAADVQDFQLALQQEMAKLGY
jgi:hypothetical protein